MRFKNKVAIVTASAGAGIGQTTLRAFADEGANIVLTDSNKDRLTKILPDITTQEGAKALGIPCDVTNRQQVDDMIKQVVSEFGTIDILVNNAGIDFGHKFMEISDEEWDLIVNVNLRGAFYCSKAVLPIMMKAKSGRIINLSSVVALTHLHENSAAYSAAKAGVIGLTKIIARDVADHNITVNAIAPGPTPNAYALRTSPPGFWDEIKKGIPLGRLGTPTDIANAILFLASEDASFITGCTIPVSGGVFMR